MADLRKDHRFIFDIHKGVEPAELDAFPAAGACSGVKLREQGTDGLCLHMVRTEKQTSVGLLHITVDVDGFFCRSRQIDGCQGLSGPALTA